jgi:hypothetical protein
MMAVLQMEPQAVVEEEQLEQDQMDFKLVTMEMVKVVLVAQEQLHL